MHQEINLYQESALRAGVRFSLLHLFQLLGAALLIFMVITLYLLYEHFTQRGLVQDLEAQQQHWSRKIQMSLGEIPTEAEKQAIAQKVSLLEETRRSNRLMLKSLGTLSITETAQFSDFFKVFSKYGSEKMALKRLEIRSGGQGFILTGVVTDPAEVPLFINRLGQDPLLKERVFEMVKMESADENGLIEFRLETD